MLSSAPECLVIVFLGRVLKSSHWKWGFWRVKLSIGLYSKLFISWMHSVALSIPFNLLWSMFHSFALILPFLSISYSLLELSFSVFSLRQACLPMAAHLWRGPVSGFSLRRAAIFLSFQVSSFFPHISPLSILLLP